MEVVSVSIGVGLAVSLLLTELFGLAAGGMVVPGYVALFLDQPLVVALTLAAALATWGIVRALSQVIIVYGKRRIALMVLTGFLLGMAIRTAASLLGSPDPTAGAPADFAVIGYIIPGLVAIWIDRQGVVETLSVVLIASALVRLVLITCGVPVAA
jgi:poly-gamma-glutamate biosynthesis protein PgsC/CapC